MDVDNVRIVVPKEVSDNPTFTNFVRIRTADEGVYLEFGYTPAAFGGEEGPRTATIKHRIVMPHKLFQAMKDTMGRAENNGLPTFVSTSDEVN